MMTHEEKRFYDFLTQSPRLQKYWDKHNIDVSKHIIKELPEYREVIMSLVDSQIEQGIQQRVALIARNLLTKGMTIKEVKELTGLTHKEIRELKDELEN